MKHIERLKIELKGGLKVRLKKWIAKMCGLHYYSRIRPERVFDVPPMPVNHREFNRIRFEKVVPEVQRFSSQQDIKRQLIEEFIKESFERDYFQIRFRKGDYETIASLEFYTKER